MITRAMRRIAAAAVAAAFLAGGTALAHHGWAWTAGEKTTLEGVIRDIYLGQPHAALKVEAADGLWAVDLAPPAATARAGFVQGAANVGDKVTVLGNRAKDVNDKRMKAVRITVNNRNFDVYPDRVGSP